MSPNKLSCPGSLVKGTLTHRCQEQYAHDPVSTAVFLVLCDITTQLYSQIPVLINMIISVHAQPVESNSCCHHPSLTAPGSDGGQSKQLGQTKAHNTCHIMHWGQWTYIILWSVPVLTIQSVYRNIAALKVATKQPLQLHKVLLILCT